MSQSFEQTAKGALETVFSAYLPERLAAHHLPDAIGSGQLMFVAGGLEEGPEALAWQLFAPDAPGGAGGRFVPCSVDLQACCRITMAASDYLALSRGALNLQEAFMRGRLKVAGDVGLAMALGALFA